MIDPGVAWDKLSNFETAQEIREYFQSENITGLKAQPNACPIAQWFINTTGQEVSVANNIKIGAKEEIYIDYLGREQYGEAYEWEFKHSDATLDFIEQFDGGKYPELLSNQKLIWED